ncbi:MAG TPA: hypothetical protein VMQ52_03285 [Candidatus Saccharimonadales bacterium]|nr:hypothetical protein [Candidatus Saccharimonadales bacterium]
MTGKKLDMTKESIPSPERKDYLVPPVRLAIVSRHHTPPPVSGGVMSE